VEPRRISLYSVEGEEERVELHGIDFFEERRKRDGENEF
jgi:hypothetical protein